MTPSLGEDLKVFKFMFDKQYQQGLLEDSFLQSLNKETVEEPNSGDFLQADKEYCQKSQSMSSLYDISALQEENSQICNHLDQSLNISQNYCQTLKKERINTNIQNQLDQFYSLDDVFQLQKEPADKNNYYSNNPRVDSREDNMFSKFQNDNWQKFAKKQKNSQHEKNIADRQEGLMPQAKSQKKRVLEKTGEDEYNSQKKHNTQSGANSNYNIIVKSIMKKIR